MLIIKYLIKNKINVCYKNAHQLRAYFCRIFHH
jgi:hypothetical protein